MTDILLDLVQKMKAILNEAALEERILLLNEIRSELHEVSPFKEEPVDCVLWIVGEEIKSNTYNPNSVAPAELKLLEHSIRSDGYTQPIVVHDGGSAYEVVDGFHRNKVGKETSDIKARIKGYLPIVKIKADRSSIEDRMASTIRHNRARGKHGIDPMTDLVGYLAKKGWDNSKICKELGMDPDEVLRFRQIGGLAEIFSDREFSEAWEVKKDS